MELQSVVDQMIYTSRRIEKATQEIFKMAREKADTEYEYRKALSLEIAKLKSEGMAVSILYETAKGNVAELLHKRDLADAMFKSAIESLRALQSQLNGLQTVSKYQSDTGG